MQCKKAHPAEGGVCFAIAILQKMHNPGEILEHMITGRRTAKLKAAEMLLLELGADIKDREAAYTYIEQQGYNWDGKSKTWSKNNPWMGSAFEDAHNRPTGHIKLRLMCHPDDREEALHLISSGLGDRSITITEISEPYDNRKGVGVRTYITAQMKH